MCLVINEKYHKFFIGRFLPRFSIRDIVISKELMRWGPTRYTTFYMHTPVVFKNGIASLFSVLRQNCTKIGTVNVYDIDQGIHAYRRELDFAKFYNFRAVIPKGTFYYIGKGGDIVANRIRIFENDEAFRRYMSKRRRAPIYADSFK